MLYGLSRIIVINFSSSSSSLNDPHFFSSSAAHHQPRSSSSSRSMCSALLEPRCWCGSCDTEKRSLSSARDGLLIDFRLLFFRLIEPHNTRQQWRGRLGTWLKYGCDYIIIHTRQQTQITILLLERLFEPISRELKMAGDIGIINQNVMNNKNPNEINNKGKQSEREKLIERFL